MLFTPARPSLRVVFTTLLLLDVAFCRDPVFTLQPRKTGELLVLLVLLSTVNQEIYF